MSIKFLLLIFILFTSTLCKLKKNKCVVLGGDCDLFHQCCGKFRCRDYRCAPKETKDNQMKWAPKGMKCDWFHQCSDHYECQSHRCILNKEKLDETLAKKP